MTYVSPLTSPFFFNLKMTPVQILHLCNNHTAACHPDSPEPGPCYLLPSTSSLSSRNVDAVASPPLRPSQESRRGGGCLSPNLPSASSHSPDTSSALKPFPCAFLLSNDTSFQESLYFPLAPGNPVLTHKVLVLFPQNCHC